MSLTDVDIEEFEKDGVLLMRGVEPHCMTDNFTGISKTFIGYHRGIGLFG